MARIMTLNEYNSSGSVRLQNDLSDDIRRCCSYKKLNDDGSLLGAGEYLKKYGQRCDYSIRDKEWDIEVLYAESPTVILKWMSQGDITSDIAKDCLLDMLGEVVEDCADIGDNVTLVAWERGNGDERHPQLRAVWDTYRCEWTDVKVDSVGRRIMPRR